MTIGMAGALRLSLKDADTADAVYALVEGGRLTGYGGLKLMGTESLQRIIPDALPAEFRSVIGPVTGILAATKVEKQGNDVTIRSTPTPQQLMDIEGLWKGLSEAVR